MIFVVFMAIKRVSMADQGDMKEKPMKNPKVPLDHFGFKMTTWDRL